MSPQSEQSIRVLTDQSVLATGYKRPSVDFLPKDLFPSGEAGDYNRPNLYLQVGIQLQATEKVIEHIVGRTSR